MRTSRVTRSYSLHVAARDELWLYDSRHGVSLEEIADREGVSAQRVRFGLERAKAAEAKMARDDGDREDGQGKVGFELIPLFPVGPLTPMSACPHHGPIPRGSKLVCMVCHQSGIDDHPGLRRDDGS